MYLVTTGRWNPIYGPFLEQLTEESNNFMTSYYTQHTHSSPHIRLNYLAE